MGEEALTDVDHLVVRKRGGPGLRWLLNLIITNRIFIVEPGGPRRDALAWDLCIF